MNTPASNLRSRRPSLWFCSTTQEWTQQQAAISDINAVLPEAPVLLSARIRDTALRERISWLQSARRTFAIEPYGEAVDADVQNPSKWIRTEKPWLVPPPPSPTNYPQWMLTSLRHQMSFRPSVLITPSPFLSVTNASQMAEQLTDAAHIAAAELGSPVDCLIGFSGSRDWLRAEAALQSVGNVLVDSKLAGVYLRISHRENVVRDRQYLHGLRQLTIGLSDAGFQVFLPNSGRLGWLALAWGASSISAGITQGSWSERERTRMSQPTQPSQWYYEHQLGMEVRWRHHDRLTQLRDYRWCQCQHCQHLQNGYDPALARRHAVFQLAIDVAQVQVASNGVRRRRIRDRLTEMKTFNDLVTRRLGSDWEGYERDFVERWLEAV